MPQWNVGKAIIHYQTGFLDSAEVELLNGPVYDINLRCESTLKNTLFCQSGSSIPTLPMAVFRHISKISTKASCNMLFFPLNAGINVEI